MKIESKQFRSGGNMKNLVQGEHSKLGGGIGRFSLGAGGTISYK